MPRFRVRLMALGLGTGLMLAAAPSLPGCLGAGDGNPPRGSISAPRGKEGVSEDSQIAAARSKARGGRPGGKSGGR
jgi:hypothetical protein